MESPETATVLKTVLMTPTAATGCLVGVSDEILQAPQASPYGSFFLDPTRQ